MSELDRLKLQEEELEYEQRCVQSEIAILNSRLAEIFRERQEVIEEIGRLMINGTHA